MSAGLHVLDCMGKCIVDQEEYLVSTNLILLDLFFKLKLFPFSTKVLTITEQPTGGVKMELKIVLVAYIQIG